VETGSSRGSFSSRLPGTYAEPYKNPHRGDQ
jgi:hypothetical protein